MKNSILFLVLIFPGYCFSQVHITFSPGLAGFKMEDMKTHQAEIQAQFPIGVKIIESFPVFWSYELSITGDVTDVIRVGGTIGFTSTGGRMHYQDYSGEIECNQFTTARVIAIQGEVLLNPRAKWPLYFTAKTGAIFGRYDLDLFSEVNNTSDSESLEFNSCNLFIEPGFLTSKRIVGILSAHLSAGYNLNVVQGKQKFANNTDQYLLDNSGKELHLDWSGFRVAIGLSIGF